mgnify:CR=1 FL=1
MIFIEEHFNFIEKNMSREAQINRKTKETDISVKVNLDGSGQRSIETGIPFFDHMLDHFARHSMIDMDVKAVGDVTIDGHHTVEDVGLALGKALLKALGDKRGITRYGFASVPMNEALVEVSIDISGRPFCVFDSVSLEGKVGEFDVELAEEFLRAFSNNAAITTHVSVKRGTNMHHILEATFKSLARALGQAIMPDLRLQDDIPSTKEVL